MKITFLGTSAGESYPAIWCDCENCTYARKHGGRNIRMNTGSMIDSDILMDMNSCGFYTAARLGVSLTGIKYLLVTHPHSDHLTLEPLAWRRENGNASELTGDARLNAISPRFTPLPMMTVYGNRFTEEKLVGAHPEWFDGTEKMQMRFERISEGVRMVASDDLAFTPVRSRHDEPGFSHSYILERGGKTLLYALDTAGYDPDMLEIILNHRYDGVVMEGTFGLNPGENAGHMTKARNIAFRKMLIERGCIHGSTPFFLTHLCPHWTPPYDIYAPMMADEGFIVAYDGLVAEI